MRLYLAAFINGYRLYFYFFRVQMCYRILYDLYGCSSSEIEMGCICSRLVKIHVVQRAMN